MSSRLLRGLTAVAVIAAAAVAATGPAGASPTSLTGSVIGSQAQLSPDVARTVKGGGADARGRALAEYWTPERMKAAKPDTEIPAVKAAIAAGKAVGDLAASATKPQGPSSSVAPAASAASAAQPKASGDVSTDAYDPGYPANHPVAMTSGKVFFTLNGGNYVCSATVVNSEGKSTVWTAGHCLSGSGAWATNWTFVPAYNYGSAPYGYWYATGLWTTTAWFYNGDFANDVGSAIMGRNFGYRIVEYLGGQGIGWNYPLGQYVYAFGYPAASPFDGGKLWAENGPTYDGGGGTIYMLNYMTGGSSGGGWLMSFDGNYGYLNGHNDFKYNAYPQYMFSPYYGNQVADLYNNVRNISS